MKKFFFFLPLLIEFFLEDEKFMLFSPLCFPQKNTNLSLSCVVLLYYTLYKKRA